MEVKGNPTDKNHAICIICNKPLKGKQTKYCCRKCHNKSGNKKFQDYESQKSRGFNRKMKLLQIFGGKCESCGYSKNWSALSFHHIADKQFNLDLRQCSNRKWSDLLTEVKKCQLLCLNCHAEVHNPTHCLDFCPKSPLL